VVVFGDHTRTFKFVDFPFVRGADGTQILKPKPGIDPLFFYYALRAIDLPSRGYNRHFKALKEKEIGLPAEPEQFDIGRVLKLVEDSLTLQDEELRAWDSAKRAAMGTLFTRGLRDEAQKETEIGAMPVTWRPRSISDLCEIWSGGTPRKSVPEYWAGPVPWVSGKDLKAPTLDDAIDHVSDAAVEAGSRLAPADAVLILVRGMGLAKDLPVAVISRPMAFNQDIKGLVSRGDFNGSFIRSAVYSRKDQLLSRIVPSAHGTMTLNLDDIETFKIPCPSDRDEAKEIVAILDAIDRKIDLHKRKRAVLAKLFKSLLHALMTGEIRVADIDLTALVSSKELEAAE
jgi:type I restriction enzyme S subunit